jgi:hypothetical protein
MSGCNHEMARGGDRPQPDEDGKRHTKIDRRAIVPSSRRRPGSSEPYRPAGNQNCPCLRAERLLLIVSDNAHYPEMRDNASTASCARNSRNRPSTCAHPITTGKAEGINSKLMAIQRSARGFRSHASFRTAALFHCGGLDLHPTSHGAQFTS